MTTFTQALASFWSNFGMIAYQNDMVPDDAQFPYITFEVVQGAPFGGTVLTARMWQKDKPFGDNALPHIAAFLDQVNKAIPPQGVRLTAAVGFFILYPNEAGFLSYEVDPSTASENLKLLCGRVSYEIHYYG